VQTESASTTSKVFLTPPEGTIVSNFDEALKYLKREDGSDWSWKFEDLSKKGEKIDWVVDYVDLQFLASDKGHVNSVLRKEAAFRLAQLKLFCTVSEDEVALLEEILNDGDYFVAVTKFVSKKFLDWGGELARLAWFYLMNYGHTNEPWDSEEEGQKCGFNYVQKLFSKSIRDAELSC